mmetsp:Transcript_17559/g.40645  ORF Transcript_17559/g.40645 Transcript_17559/m.40645 type:complete len:110 (-) Transcript_17559:35-364(-)
MGICCCFSKRMSPERANLSGTTLGSSHAFALNIRSASTGDTVQICDVHIGDTLEDLRHKVQDAVGSEIGALRRESSSEMRIFQVTELDKSLYELGVRAGSHIAYLDKAT